MKKLEGLMTTNEAAEVLGLKPWQLWYDVKLGRIKPHGTLGETPQCGYVFSRADVLGYKRKNRKAGRRTRPHSFSKDMLALKDVADLLGISRARVEGLIRRGKLKVDGKVSGVRYILKGTLDEFRKNGRGR